MVIFLITSNTRTHIHNHTHNHTGKPPGQRIYCFRLGAILRASAFTCERKKERKKEKQKKKERKNKNKKKQDATSKEALELNDLKGERDVLSAYCLDSGAKKLFGQGFKHTVRYSTRMILEM